MLAEILAVLRTPMPVLYPPGAGTMTLAELADTKSAMSKALRSQIAKDGVNVTRASLGSSDTDT